MAIFFHFNRNLLLGISAVILVAILFVILTAGIDKGAFQFTTNRLFEIKIQEKKYIYLLHHLFCFLPVFLIGVIYPFFASRWNFYKEWTFSMLIVSILFIFWDIIFSRLGVWGFNPSHIVGIGINNFPIEEIFWFPVIGYCSLFIHALILKSNSKMEHYGNVLVVLIFLTFGLIVEYPDRIYTAFSSWAVLVTIWLFYTFKREVLFEKFTISFGIILLPMLLADGYLTGMFTGEATILYNPLEFSEIRIISIPIEDFLFGFCFLATIVLLNSLINKRFSGF